MDLRLLRVELEEFAEVLGTTCVEYRVRAVSDRLATAEAAQTVGVDGQEIPLRSVESRIKNAAERSRRDALESARLDAIADLNGLRREMLELSHEEVRRLGSPDYATFCRNLSGIDLARLRELTLPILPRSRDMYEEALRGGGGAETEEDAARLRGDAADPGRSHPRRPAERRAGRLRGAPPRAW